MKKQKTAFLGQRGQVVVEYVLLLAFSAIIAVALSKSLVSRDREDPGIVTFKWRSFLNFVGDDYSDEYE